jgi:hypothetical protein
VAQAVEHLPSNHEALSSNLSPVKKKKKKEEEEVLTQSQLQVHLDPETQKLTPAPSLAPHLLLPACSAPRQVPMRE